MELELGLALPVHNPAMNHDNADGSTSRVDYRLKDHDASLSWSTGQIDEDRHPKWRKLHE